MSISLQLQLITYFFVGLLLLIALLLISAAFGVSTLRQHQAWVDHTNEVLREIEITQRLYAEADYQAQSRISTGQEAPQLADARQKVFDAIARLREKTIDNADQTVKCDSLAAAIRQRFETQDIQAATAQPNGDRVDLDKLSVVQMSESAKRIDILFYNLQLNELSLLQQNRMPRLTYWQWILVYFTFAVMTLLLIVTSVLFYLCRRYIRRNLLVGRKMDEVIHTTDARDAVKLQKQIKKFRDWVLETDASLT